MYIYYRQLGKYKKFKSCLTFLKTPIPLNIWGTHWFAVIPYLPHTFYAYLKNYLLICSFKDLLAYA